MVYWRLYMHRVNRQIIQISTPLRLPLQHVISCSLRFLNLHLAGCASQQMGLMGTIIGYSLLETTKSVKSNLYFVILNRIVLLLMEENCREQF